MSDEIRQKISTAFTKHIGDPISVTEITPLTGGASADTWSVSIRKSNQSEEEGYILRRSEGSADNSFSTSITKATEANVQKVALEFGVPAPSIKFILDETDALGEGYVMGRVDGETIPRKILRDETFADARTHMAKQCGAILANIHQIPVDRLPTDLPSQPALQQLDQLYRLFKTFNEPSPALEVAFRWLRDNAPDDSDLALVHGDFRNGNFIVTEEGIRTVLDWELSHIGNPMEDLGWLCVNSWRFGQLDLPVGGFGLKEDLFTAYEEVTGKPVNESEVHYWETFGTLKWGIICFFQTFTHLWQQRRSVELAAIGRRVSETELDLLQLIYPTSA